MPIFRTKNEDFFKKWSPEMAYVLGFFAADGNMSIHSNSGHYIEFTSCDAELIRKTRDLLKSNNKLSNRIRSDKQKVAYRIQIGSNTLYKSLLSLGMTPNKSLTLKFPKIKPSRLKDFIRGYFDGDGCVYLKRHFIKARGKFRWVFQVRFTSGSRQFLKSLHLLLKTSKICKGGYLYEKNRGHELVFSHHDGLALFRFMYDNVPTEMYLERKYNTFQKAFSVLYLGA
ncbi:MAG: LAGLIDADG family homing endonuclease [Bacteroidota bacterium]